MPTPSQILAAVPETGLFRSGKPTASPSLPWRLTPEPLRLSKKLARQLTGLGHVLACFQDACHELYLRSAAGEIHPWLAAMLDAGKPAWLVEAQRSQSMRRAAPRVIRPDLMLGENGFALSELDSVPGGQGTALFLSRLYAAHGDEVLGGAEGMLDGFRAAHPEGAVIAVSDESADYRPEMEYFVRELGEGYEYARAETLAPSGMGGRTLYRFFELFDAENVPPARELIAMSARGELAMSPPPVQHLEEKIWLALFHMPGLQSTWKKLLRNAHFERLKELIPRGWIADPTPLPPQAALPWLHVHDWAEVAAMSQKERRLVLKISGFDPAAWGARGVYIGHDMPSGEWKEALQRALDDYPQKLWLLQEFRPAAVIEHPYYLAPDTEAIAVMKGRVRLCPYYYRHADGRTLLAGCLATIAPADKKKIHGMKDAILAPCIIR